jgi:hypothetical protein
VYSTSTDNVALTHNAITWASATATPTITQSSTSAGTGATLSIIAQGATGASNNGGVLALSSGSSGSATAGAINFQVGGTTALQLASLTSLVPNVDGSAGLNVGSSALRLASVTAQKFTVYHANTDTNPSVTVTDGAVNFAAANASPTYGWMFTTATNTIALSNGAGSPYAYFFSTGVEYDHTVGAIVYSQYAKTTNDGTAARSFSIVAQSGYGTVQTGVNGDVGGAFFGTGGAGSPTDTATGGRGGSSNLGAGAGGAATTGTGGNGGSISILGGSGGAASNAGGTNGSGGNVTISSGAAGNGIGVASTAGVVALQIATVTNLSLSTSLFQWASGITAPVFNQAAPAAVSISPGTAATTFTIAGQAGGATSATAGTAGNATTTAVIAGAGGNATGTGATTGGAGGTLNLTGGAGGGAATGAAGNGGNVVLTPGAGGSGTTNGVAGVVQIAGSLNVTVSGLKTANYQIARGDYYVAFGTFSSAVSATLPNNPVIGDRYEVKDVNGSITAINTLTVLPFSGYTIDNEASKILTVQYASAVFTYTGASNWSVG